MGGSVVKIKYDLQVIHNVVLIKVLDMEDKYRCKNKTLYLFTSTNGVKIHSGSTVGLYSNSVYVLGEYWEEKYLSDSIKFDTNEEAQAYADKVKFALDEWNNHVDITEIEFEDMFFDSNKYFKNEKYSVVFGKSIHSKTLDIYLNEDIIKTYIITAWAIPFNDTKIMFNRDCELLNIPFRLK